MKKLSKHIYEKLIINKNTLSNNKSEYLSWIDELKSIKNYDDLDKFLIRIENAGTCEPDISTEDFDVSDYFEHWVSDRGEYDDVYDTVKDNCQNNFVIGWGDSKSFDNLDNDVPGFFQYIMYESDWDCETINQKFREATKIWRKDHFGKIRHCGLMKCNMIQDDDNDEYLYLFFIDISLI